MVAKSSTSEDQTLRFSNSSTTTRHVHQRWQASRHRTKVCEPGLHFQRKQQLPDHSWGARNQLTSLLMNMACGKTRRNQVADSVKNIVWFKTAKPSCSKMANWQPPLNCHLAPAG
jgi:hypothetical protein